MNVHLTPAVIAKLAAKYGSSITTRQLVDESLSFYYEANKGGLPKLRRGLFGLTASAAEPERAAPKIDAKELASRIRERFQALEDLGNALISNNIRSLIVSGAPGVGKSYTLCNMLASAERNGDISSVVEIKGSISGIGLFLTLWENREQGNVIVLDDIDSVFGDEEAMNLLKGALDSSETRKISWIKDSSFLRDREIPTTFEYEGQIVFITNVDMDAVIERGSKMAPHMNALLSRSVFLDLAIHSNEAVMVRIEQILAETSFARELGLKNSQVVMAVDWMKANLSNLRNISLRTMIQIAGFMKSSSRWESLARVTLLRPN